MTDHDSLAQPSPFRSVPSIATGDTAAPDRDRGPDDATIAAIRERMARAEYPSFTRFSFDDVRDLFSALDAVTAERDRLIQRGPLVDAFEHLQACDALDAALSDNAALLAVVEAAKAWEQRFTETRVIREGWPVKFADACYVLATAVTLARLPR